MITQWFLNGVIISLIINFMGKYGEANIEEEQENAKYLEGLGLSQTAKDERAFQMVKDRIKDVLRQEKSRIFYTPNDEGPRKYYYKKYMKLDKARDENMDYDNKEIRRLSKHNFNKFMGNIIKTEKNPRDFQESSAITEKETVEKNVILDKLNEYSQGVKSKVDPTVLHDKLSNNNNYLKENSANASLHIKNENNLPKNIIHQTKELNPSLRINNENFKLINAYLDQMKNQKEKYLQKDILNEKSMITGRNNIAGIDELINEQQKQNSSVNSIRTSRSLKGLHHKTKRKCYKPDKKANENKKTHKSNVLQLKDNRRVRSCDIKMEDLRESFIPNEQLSIYHPKMSLSDQFILQDTMF